MKTTTILTPRSIYPMAPEHCQRHRWAIYDGCIGYESHKCELCGTDATDLKNAITLEDLDRLHELPALRNTCELLLAIAETIPQPPTHDGLKLADALAKAREIVARSGKEVA